MRTWLWIGTLMICFVSGGASCARREPPMPFPPPPVALNETPSVEELATVMNRTSSIQQLSTNTATVEVLTMPNIPKLSATLSLQRERRFRLRASLPIVLGAGMDLGSNEDVFWFEVPEGMSKTLYYAEHEKYRQQLQRAILPVDPTWIMDALGLVQLDPSTVVAGPLKRADGKLEIRSVVQMPDGLYQRVYFLEAAAGYVTNQFLYSPDGRLIAQSTATNHRYYPEHQSALPHQVELHLTPTMGPPLGMKISIGTYAVNQLLSGDPQLFTMPQNASQAVDLTTLSGTANAVQATPATEYTADLRMAMPLRGTMQSSLR
ncbi:hypothetical protein Pla52o_08280 [Novipirellula galeiformis]|uniref:DUF4292 domain-containing protein n=1 Tax=Novipirellula galeiformis TaxID=2528004 RepID=A0A5C6CR85_9BACT|nr:hypothetical protein [Novipirellula galeiformis]TWU26972.1 hypothetical protein Pla52o_08280 [Novipirellula galeiformis]